MTDCPPSGTRLGAFGVSVASQFHLEHLQQATRTKVFINFIISESGSDDGGRTKIYSLESASGVYEPLLQFRGPTNVLWRR